MNLWSERKLSPQQMVYTKLEILRWISIIKILTLKRNWMPKCRSQKQGSLTPWHNLNAFTKKCMTGHKLIHSFIHFYSRKKGHKFIHEWRMILEGVKQALLGLDETLPFLVSQTIKVCLQCRIPRFNPWLRRIPWRKEWQPTPVFFPGEFCEQRL